MQLQKLAADARKVIKIDANATIGRHVSDDIGDVGEQEPNGPPHWPFL